MTPGNKSESIKDLTAALAKAQVSFLPIKRTEKVDFSTTAGGRKKYNYAPLDAVIDATRKALSDNGLAVTQVTKLVDGTIVLETLLSHSTGEWLFGELYVGKQEMPPQSLGSALTYMRRYGIASILCVASEEDDDAVGSQPGGEAGKSTTKAKTDSVRPASPPLAGTEAKSSLPVDDKGELAQAYQDYAEDPPVPIVKDTGFDMDWLRENIGVFGKRNYDFRDWLRSKANYQGLDLSGGVTQMVARMSPEQKKFLSDEIKARLEMR